MGAFSRSKGQRGEREVAAIISDLLGLEVKRRVRQHDGDSDLVGVDKWSIEVKNCATLQLNEWWRQTVEQAGNNLPVLFYKVPRKGWRCKWPAAAHLAMQEAHYWTDIEWTLDGDPQVWAAFAREML